jgi:hypothetical protein
LSIGLVGSAQAASFLNGGFESNNYSGWTQGSGTNSGLTATGSGALALNPASYATNTNWQGYAGESTMSYLTQMLALAVQNFLSAATKGVGVTALEPDHALPLICETNQQIIQLGLRQSVVAAFFTRINPFRLRIDQGHHRGGYEMVVYQHIGLCYEPGCLKC